MKPSREFRRSAPPPHLGATWEVDLAPVPVGFTDDPGARPALLLVVAGGFILAGDIVSHPSADPAAVAEALANAIRVASTSAGGPPRGVHVRHRSVAEKLGALLAPAGIKVRDVPGLPDVDAALAGFSETFLGIPKAAGPRPRAASPDTWAGWGLPKAQIGRVFAAAAGYFRAAPWSNVTNEDFLRIEVHGGGAWSTSIMGMAGEEFGLAIYERHQDLLSLLASDAEDPGGAMSAIKGTVISLSYNRREELSRAMRKEIREARWQIAGPGAYPTMMAINTPGGGVTERAMEDMIAMLGAIVSFTEAHEPMLAGHVAPRYPIRWQSGDGEVSIIFHGAPDRLG